MSATHAAAVKVDGLVKRFGDFEAVKGVTFEVEAAEVFGFLGPNGAGKSTTIGMLCTLIKPSGGHAQVAGHATSAWCSRIRHSTAT